MGALSKAGTNVGKALMRCKPIAKMTRIMAKNKPEILAISGGIMILGAFGWAIYEAVGLKETLIETSDTVKAVEEAYTEEEKVEKEKEYRKEITRARVKGVMKVGKKFVGPTVCLAVGMGLGTKGFKVLKARNVMLGTALKGTEEAYKFYRNNVREDLGKEADLKYARGIVGEKEIEEIIKDKDGNNVKVKSKVPVVKEQPNNPWRFEYSDTWFSSYQDSAESNLFFLKCEQKWWNHELERYPYTGVSMYDILKHIGYKFEVLQEGMTPKQFKERINFLRMNGWRKGSGGDDIIDFGLFREINEAVIKRQSDVVWIEFNCDGPLDVI